MLAFRNDMLKLAGKYPGIVKVVVDGDLWESTCASFDEQIKEERGFTENNIKEKDGGMWFAQMEVAKDEK